uniref:Disease resistance protein RPS5 n=1 Tax=Noccaea caerulescens TaxID=107243 RepID=A0A1J3JYU4_NOCCA
MAWTHSQNYQQTPKSHHLSSCFVNLSWCVNCKMGDVISKSTEFVVNLFCSCLCAEVHHICRLDKNLEALEKAMGTLQARRDDVLIWVQRDEDTGLQRLNGVKVWLKDVETIENQADKIERNMACTSELQLSTCCEVCSKKLGSRFRYGKEVFSMLEDVKELIITGDFNAVAAPALRDVVEERDLQQIIFGQKTILEKAWNRLMDKGTNMMGLYGMGGVGKTTLLEQINNKFKVANDDGFEKVIWVVVSKDKRSEKIQDEIAEKLGFTTGGDSWKQKTETQKASDIRTSMKKKRFVLLLDDIWSKVELKELGVPFPTKANKCKLVFTTRLREVCERMGVNEPIEVSCLDTDKAWDLFKERVGENTLGSHPGIPELARKVAGKCGGLPLALNVLGESMSYQKTIQEWRHAVKTLTKFSGMDDEVLRILKYSYDSLKEEHVKPCFLYCSLFPEDFEIRKDRLIEYWICEGFIQEKQSREEAFDQGYGILSALVRVCLLLEVSIYKVRMHDVVREMALWVANDLGEHKGRYTVQAGVGLREIPEVENWGIVRKMSLMNNEIENISDSPDCPELTTLLLQDNKLRSISTEFFQRMPRLLVLDLSQNSWLPEKISKLVALRYLDLTGTHIERLPVGLDESKMLIYLNLEFTSRLDSISGISKFSRLRRLGLWNSKTKLDMSLLKELQLLKYLQVVTISIRSSLVAEQLVSYHSVVKCIQKLDYSLLREESFTVLTLPTMVNLCDLEIEKCGMKEIKTEGAPSSSWNKSPTSPSFLNLTTVTIDYCNGLKDLTWLLFAPNLIHLIVGHSNQLECIISEEKAASGVTEKEAGSIIPFGKLEHFNFYGVPMLNSIYWSSLPFPCLRGIRVAGCGNLRKLPLDSKSVAKLDGFVIQSIERHWTKGIEWEDEATKLRFQSAFKDF